VSYPNDMRAVAEERRAQAAATTDTGLKRWLLSRADFFEQCATEAEARDTEELSNEIP